MICYGGLSVLLHLMGWKACYFEWVVFGWYFKRSAWLSLEKNSSCLIRTWTPGRYWSITWHAHNVPACVYYFRVVCFNETHIFLNSTEAHYFPHWLTLMPKITQLLIINWDSPPVSGILVRAQPTVQCPMLDIICLFMCRHRAMHYGLCMLLKLLVACSPISACLLNVLLACPGVDTSGGVIG